MSDMLSWVLREISGPLSEFFKKLGGEGGTEWLVAFKRFLRKENPWPDFKVWRTVTIRDREFKLVLVTPEDLDFLGAAYYYELLAAAKRKGLQSCSRDVFDHISVVDYDMIVGFENSCQRPGNNPPYIMGVIIQEGTKLVFVLP
jgi:hypothetical protein